jgi:hypothetical protein
MRKVFSGFCVCLLMSATGARADSVADLGWLSGCWAQTNGDKVVEEVWLKPSGGMMAGVGRTVRNDQLRNLEFMQIGAKDGIVTFTALPSGQAEASFPAISQAENEIVFENTVHDFPQKITYRSLAPDSLYAAIEGPMDGKTRKIEFHYNRCEAK